MAKDYSKLISWAQNVVQTPQNFSSKEFKLAKQILENAGKSAIKKPPFKEKLARKNIKRK